MYFRRDAGIQKMTVLKGRPSNSRFFVWSVEQHSQNLHKFCICQVGGLPAGSQSRR